MSISRFALAVALALLPAPALAQMDMSNMDMPHEQPAAASKWQIHSHTLLNLVADNQEGPRGGSKTFLAGMSMLSASRPLSDDDSLQLSAMLSPDPFMGRDGYPLLLQSGETADGADPLVDRQHPHDLVMGLSARLTHRFNGGSAFVEAGYPGEVAFGPPAFMHRASGDAFPNAPISHHWLESGHITMGLLTAGVTRGRLTFEVSQFTGREPDEKRVALDPITLDSTAARLSWRVNDDLSLQASWARQISPEALEPDINLRKTSLGLTYGHTFQGGRLDTTVAWGRKSAEQGHDKASDAWLVENSFRFNGPWQTLARYERTYNVELTGSPAWVAKTEVGLIRSFDVNAATTLGLGIIRQYYSVPPQLRPDYGRRPGGTLALIQLRFHAMKM